MSKINVGRVLLGGLFAGLVINIGEFILNGVLFAKDIEDANRKLNLPPPSGNFIAVAVILVFLVGIAAVYIYAGIRPRFGSGVKTAICAGLIVWFLAFVFPGLLYMAGGIYPARLTILGLLWGLFEVPIGTVAGAWLYKEGE